MFLKGLGAATADALYGVIAAFGLTSIAQILIDQNLMFKALAHFFYFIWALRFLNQNQQLNLPISIQKAF